MESYRHAQGADGQARVPVPYRGTQLLAHPMYNKSTAFSRNESILGLGDQGAGGMPIPVGKLALYTAAAGIHPARTLPVSLDVGTDNQALLEDDLYLGWRHPRLRGKRYLELVDEFVQAVRRRFPKAVLQWEDFRKGTAFVEGADADEHYRRGLMWPAALATWHGLVPSRPRDLAAVVKALRPTVLIGVSGAPGAFTEAIVREMATQVERPAIFPMSNPTSQSEAAPADVLAWTGGRALVASGSPFAPVTQGRRTVRIGQGNNAFIFPGVGLGALVAQACEITDGMFAAAARRLAEEVRPEDLEADSLFPRISDLRAVTARIAQAVVREAGAAGRGRALSDAEIPAAVRAAMWEPVYPELEPAAGETY